MLPGKFVTTAVIASTENLSFLSIMEALEALALACVLGNQESCMEIDAVDQLD